MKTLLFGLPMTLESCRWFRSFRRDAVRLALQLERRVSMRQAHCQLGMDEQMFLRLRFIFDKKALDSA